MYLNLLDKIKDDILLENIDNNNVYTSKVCTFEDQEYYSCRGNNDGRIYSVIGSKKWILLNILY